MLENKKTNKTVKDEYKPICVMKSFGNQKHTEYNNMQIRSKDDQFDGRNISTFCFERVEERSDGIIKCENKCNERKYAKENMHTTSNIS